MILTLMSKLHDDFDCVSLCRGVSLTVWLSGGISISYVFPMFDLVVWDVKSSLTLWLDIDACHAHTVTTLAGNAGDTYQISVDAFGTNAVFADPSGIAIATSGTIYVSDESSNAIRAMSSGASGFCRGPLNTHLYSLIYVDTFAFGSNRHVPDLIVW